MPLAERKDRLEAKDPVYRIEPDTELFLGPSPDSDCLIVNGVGVEVTLLPILAQTAPGAIAVRFNEGPDKPPRLLFLPLPDRVWPESSGKAIAEFNTLSDARKTPTVRQRGNIYNALQLAIYNISSIDSLQRANCRYILILLDLGEQIATLLEQDEFFDPYHHP